MPLEISIGIDESDRAEVVEALSRVLADTYTLHLKTLNYHWNVTGPMFRTLHDLFEDQHEELAEAVDDLAERIRALGHPAPGSYQAFSRLTSLRDPTEVPDAEGMIRELAADHDTIARLALETLDVADDADDPVTEDLLIERMEEHHRTAWMLRSLLG